MKAKERQIESLRHKLQESESLVLTLEQHLFTQPGSQGDYEKVIIEKDRIIHFLNEKVKSLSLDQRSEVRSKTVDNRSKMVDIVDLKGKSSAAADLHQSKIFQLV